MGIVGRILKLKSHEEISGHQGVLKIGLFGRLDARHP